MPRLQPLMRGTTVLSDRRSDEAGVGVNEFEIDTFRKRQGCTPTRWAPTSYKWSYNPYKWPYKWVTGVITLLIEVRIPFITSRGPPCTNVPRHGKSLYKPYIVGIYGL